MLKLRTHTLTLRSIEITHKNRENRERTREMGIESKNIISLI